MQTNILEDCACRFDIPVGKNGRKWIAEQDIATAEGLYVFSRDIQMWPAQYPIDIDIY